MKHELDTQRMELRKEELCLEMLKAGTNLNTQI